MKSKKDVINKCSVCGEQGHNKRFHEVRRTEKPCGGCKRILPIGRFRIQRVKRANGRIVENKSYLCADCDIVKSAERYRSNPKNRLGYLLYSAKSRSVKEGRAFEIDIEYLCNLYEQQAGLCFYTGRPMSLDTGDDAISIERKDPSLGYVVGNVVLTCWIVNNMKRHMRQQEFIDMCRLIANYHG